MASSLLKLLVAAVLAATMVAGCGENPEGVDTGTGTGSTTYSGTGTTPSYSYPTSTGGSVYGNVPATGVNGTIGCGSTGTTTGTTTGATTGTTTGTAAQTGCGQAVPSPSSSVAPSKIGMEASITAREESGIFSKSLKSVAVAVANHDAVERSRFLMVIFSKKGLEVEVQYKSIRMPAGGSQNFNFKAVKDADDASVELRDTLL